MNSNQQTVNRQTVNQQAVNGQSSLLLTRRNFFGELGATMSAAALASLLPADCLADSTIQRLPHFKPTAKRVLFLCQSGAPSQIDLFDPKPELTNRQGEELPENIRLGQRLTEMTSDQESKPLTGSVFKFRRHGESQTPLSELLPYTARIADDLCFVHSMHTDAINHDPAITMLQSGSQLPGRPSIGAWASYGLGSESKNLPAYVVMVSGGQTGDQPLAVRQWGSGFLSTEHQGLKFRGGGDPVLYLDNPAGVDRRTRDRMYEAIDKFNSLQFDETNDPAIQERMEQYRLAQQMQLSVPSLVDLSTEPQSTINMYGKDVLTPGSYAANCVIARRLLERDVRFVQLFHRGWDHHERLPSRIQFKCRQTDQPSAALIADLKQRGLLEDTLVVWAGEFGRTAYCQGSLTNKNYGRDHHPRCFSIWMSGGGVRKGFTYGKTDDFSYNVVENPVHIHDLQATILHCLGIDHTKLTYRFSGRDFRLTDVGGKVVKDLLDS